MTQRIGSIFGQRGTDARPFQTNGKCDGSGTAVSGAAGSFTRCPRCLRRFTVRGGRLPAHTP